MADKFEKRMTKFWDDVEGIFTLMKDTPNATDVPTSPNSPILTNYLLWRLLEETKGVKEMQGELSLIGEKLNRLNNKMTRRDW